MQQSTVAATKATINHGGNKGNSQLVASNKITTASGGDKNSSSNL